jgi:hypothetical protein
MARSRADDGPDSRRPIASVWEGKLQVRRAYVMTGYDDGTLDPEIFTTKGWFGTGTSGSSSAGTQPER